MAKSEPDKNLIRRLGPLAFLGAWSAVLPPIASVVLFTRMEWVSGYLRADAVYGPVAYVAGFTVLAGCALMPTYAAASLGGWAFGFPLGLLCAMIGFMAASLLAYGIVRASAGDRLPEILKEHPKWDAVTRALFKSSTGRALLIVTLLRLPPNSPFALTNLALASLGVRWWVYLTGTLVGMLPRTAAVVYAASTLQQLTLKEAGDWRWIALSVGLSIAVMIALYYIAKRTLAKITADAVL